MPAPRANIDYIEIHSADAVACDSEWQRLLESAMRDSGVEVNSLASGAGHDAMAMTGYTPMGMLFVRCADGISHHPAESIMVEDVSVALEVRVLYVDKQRWSAPQRLSKEGRVNIRCTN